MTQEQVESQLSAMFDGELPAAECELLSRRIDRDENLRARWSRYALIGAAMRSEPVATARRGFASRVSAAIDASEGKTKARTSRFALIRRRTLWNTALAASMVAAVAGVSISVLRYSGPGAVGNAVPRTDQPSVSAPPVAVAVNTQASLPALQLISGNGEPRGPYTTPINQPNSNIGLRTELADFIVAHSEYSTPLMRRSLLSALVSSEDPAEPSAPTANATGAGKIDAPSAASSAGR